MSWVTRGLELARDRCKLRCHPHIIHSHRVALALPQGKYQVEGAHNSAGPLRGPHCTVTASNYLLPLPPPLP